MARPALDYEILCGSQTQRVLLRWGSTAWLGPLGTAGAWRPAQLVLWVVSAVVFGLRPGEAGARALFMVSSAIVSSSTIFFLGLQASDLQHALLVGLWLWGSVALFGLAMAGILHFTLVFPIGRSVLARRPWLLVLVYAGPWVPYLLRLTLAWPQANSAAARLSLLVRSTGFITLAYFPLVLLGTVMSYRLAKAETERRQLRWLVWGLYVAFAPWVALNVIPELLGLPECCLHLYTGYCGAPYRPPSRLPSCASECSTSTSLSGARLYTACCRYRWLWSYFASVVLLQNLFAALTGDRRSALVTVLSTLAIAALFGPVRQRAQTVIDHQFYRRKYDAARLLSAFGAKLRDDPGADLRHLSDQLLAAVDESMQPEHATLWLRANPGAGAENSQ